MHTSNSNNPLEGLDGLPDFQRIEPEHAKGAIDALLADLRERLFALQSSQKTLTFDELIVPIEEIGHQLSRSWSPISHLHMVRNTAEWQEAYMQCLPAITDFSTQMAQNRWLFDTYVSLEAALPEEASPEQRQVIKHALREFRLSGVALADDEKQRFGQIMQSLSADQARFSNNLQACTDNWSYHTLSDGEVVGVPASTLAQAKRAASQAGQQGWLFDLTQPTYQAIITHAEDENLRERFYRAWSTRGASTGPHDAEFDNTQLMQKILANRQELAQLLGFDSYSDYSLAAKMAGSVDEVTDFLRDLADRSRGHAKAEVADIEQFAGRDLQAWDMAFFGERLKEKTYAVSEDELRAYFPVDKVLSGLFELATTLYGIKLIWRDDVSRWHEDVGYLQVADAQGAIIGGFYTDLCARGGKRAGAWIDECVVRKVLPTSQALPIGYLVCNFSPASDELPCLLSHSDVVTLFHEFGHMLHHLLTRVSFPSIAGINGVPWDAVELPSQFMENFAWNAEVISRCSAHFQTGEPLPAATFDKLLASRNASAGLQMLRQLEFALFDFELHACPDAAAPGRVREILEQTRALTSLLPPPEWNRFENGFAHIFAGGYAAGYYSYKWAEVLAADAFSAFDEAGGIFDSKVAQRFRQNILEIGGSRDIMRAFVDFRGREPRVDALLESSGIIAA